MNSSQNLLPRTLSQALHREETFRKALFERPESLSAFLVYDEFIPELGLFQMKDGSLGAVFRAELLEHEPMTAQQVVDGVSGLRSWFTLPENCTLQILFEQSAIAERDPIFTQIRDAYPDGHPVSRTLAQARLQMVQGACNQGTKLTPMRRGTLIAIRYFPSVAKSKVGQALLKRGEAVLYRELREFVRDSREFIQILSNFEHNSKVKLTRIGADEVLDYLRRFFNPKTYYKRSFAPHNPNLSLSDQIIYHSAILESAGIEREGIKTRTLTLKTNPHRAYPGGMAYFTKLGFPFKLSLNVSFPPKSKAKMFFDMKEFFLQNTPSAKARRQRDEILEVQEKLARDDRCLHVTFTVIVEAETDDLLETRVREVLSVFQNDLECEAILDDDIGLGLCLNTLPLQYTPAADYSTKRAIRTLRSDVVNFVPVFDSFQGLKRPLQLYLSREGNLVFFSLQENETSNHTVVLADSGAGKSAFVIDCVQAAKLQSPEPLVFVIDKKSSYPMLSEYFDGDLTVFDRTKEMPFSPFRGHYDEEKIAFLTCLISSGVKLTSPAFELDSTHQGAIAKAIKLAYQKKAQQIGLTFLGGELRKQETDSEVELSMDDVVAELSALPSEAQFESSARAIDDLLQKLTPFYGDGIYAQYFRSKAAKKGANKSFYIYDLDALDSDPVLQALMTTAVFEEIRRIIKLPENSGRTGFIVLEEIGMLGRDNPVASRIIVDFAETMRKLGYWLISLTPRPQNYFELEAGKAMWSVADNFLFLQMGGDNVDYLMRHSTILDEASSQIVKSLRTVRGSHAEVFYMNKKGTRKGAFSYFQTVFGRWLAPTNAKDSREAARALKRFRPHKWQALTFLAETYPQGVEAYEDAQAQRKGELK